jgi:hypothetical protein
MANGITLGDILQMINDPYEKVDVYTTTGSSWHFTMYEGTATDCLSMLDAKVVALYPAVDYKPYELNEPILCIGITY